MEDQWIRTRNEWTFMDNAGKAKFLYELLRPSWSYFVFIIFLLVEFFLYNQ